MSVAFETQKAVYTKLTAHAPLMAKVKGVYDHVPEVAEYPYATVGNLHVEDNSVKGAKGYVISVLVNIYSKAAGRKEVLEIIEMIRALLDGQALSVSGFGHVMTKLVSLNTELEDDGINRQGRILVKVSVR